MKFNVMFALFAVCSFTTTASQGIELEVEAIELQSYGTTLLVREDCDFHGYHKDKGQSVFLAKCGSSIANYKVQNSDWDITGFNVEHGVDMDVPLKLTGQTVGIDFEKVAELLTNQ